MAFIFKTPFADSGDKITIPGSVQVDGSVSIPQGWGYDYERPRELSPGVPDPDYKPVGREEMNGLMFMATQAIGEMQLQGAASWSSVGAPYPINAVVYHNSRAWLSTAANNNTEPGTSGAAWINAFQRRFFTTGEPLPTSNIGPIWHDDYNSLMTWQVFNLNGAAYTGYASQFIGEIRLETQPTARPGYRRCGSETLALSRSQFAALRAWGLHNGRFVASGVWQAGTLLMADNPDGVTFRAFDVRGEFPRFWDDGRGVDALRGFGTWEADQNKAHTHSLNLSAQYSTDDAPGNGQVKVLNGDSTIDVWNTGDPVLNDQNYIVSQGGDQAQPRNTAFAAMLKF